MISLCDEIVLEKNDFDIYQFWMVWPYPHCQLVRETFPNQILFHSFYRIFGELFTDLERTRTDAQQHVDGK